jgi:hypothetical protein
MVRPQFCLSGAAGHQGCQIAATWHRRPTRVEIDHKGCTCLERTPERQDKAQHEINWRPHSHDSHETNLRIFGGEAISLYRIHDGGC